MRVSLPRFPVHQATDISAEVTDGHRRGIQERLESSDWGRSLLSVFIGLILGTLLLIQLPGSYLRSEAVDIVDPFANATGLDQDWAVFAPEPRKLSIDLVANISYADGSRRRWRIPRSNNFFGIYWDYRWIKYMEHVNRDVNKYLWVPLARWVAREKDGASPVTRVDLIRRWSNLNPPGPGPDQSPWQEYKFFSAPPLLLRGSDAR